MIRDVPRERLLGAMEQFDRELRATSNWYESPKYHYAIEHNGRYYPVKKIIWLATGDALNTFNGGYQANTYVQKRGFKVVTRKGGGPWRVWEPR